MNVLLMSRYGSLGSRSRVRSYQYLPYLRGNGIDVTVASLLGDDYIKDLYAGRRKNFKAIFRSYLRRLVHLLKSRRFDLVWVENEILPWLPAWAEAILSRIGIPYIVDYDDAIFHRYDMHQNAMVRAFLGKKIDAIMRRAALVIAGNNYLADRARKAGARQVAYLPSVVDLDRYPIVSRKKNKVFTIGWIGSPATVQYLHLVSSALSKVCRDGSMRVVLVGSGQITLDKTPVEIRAWSEESEIAHVQSFDVGIMPLPDEPWTRGKCGYKLIQYMACARPVLASPVGINQQIVEQGVNGLLANCTADWVHAFRTLQGSKSLRESMGKAGRTKVENEYCLQVTTPRLLTLLCNITKPQ